MNLFNWITITRVKKVVPIVTVAAVVAPILCKFYHSNITPISITRDISVGETMVHGQFYDYYQDIGGQG